jgi:hypothetical protein
MFLSLPCKEANGLVPTVLGEATDRPEMSRVMKMRVESGADIPKLEDSALCVDCNSCFSRDSF